MINYYKHLKDYNYYSELYDKITIEKCKHFDTKSTSEKTSKRKLKTKDDIKKEFQEKCVSKVILHFVKGEHYVKKSETINKWMEQDRAKDKRLANAVAPKSVRCLNCSSIMTNCIERDLMSRHNLNTEEVLFMFECDKCGKRRAFWENGKAWGYKPKCSKCDSVVKKKRSRKGKIIKTVYSCSECGYVETDIIDLNKKYKEKIDSNFEKDRKKYCLSEEEGEKYLSEKASLEALKEFVDKIEEKKKNKKLYDAIAKIKKLNIAELQELLNPLIKKAKYTKLEFEKPQIQGDVIVGFSLQDNKTGREEYDSKSELTKIIKKSLENTNWRLMSDGISYRLGFLSGRLRGVEGEENLKKLINKK